MFSRLQTVSGAMLALSQLIEKLRSEDSHSQHVAHRDRYNQDVVPSKITCKEQGSRMQQAQKGRGREQRGDSSRTFFAWVIVCFLTILSVLISSFKRPGLLVRLLPLGSLNAIDRYRLSVKNFA